MYDKARRRIKKIRLKEVDRSHTCAALVCTQAGEPFEKANCGALRIFRRLYGTNCSGREEADAKAETTEEARATTEMKGAADNTVVFGLA